MFVKNLLGEGFSSLDKDIEKLTQVLDTVFSKYDLSPKEVLEALSKQKQDTLPLSVFSTKKLSVLEIVVKYLKENKEMRYSDIARLLNRDQRTIWVTYDNSLKKSKKKLFDKGGADIPISIFKDRRMPVLVSLVKYLKDDLDYSFSQISGFLNKNYQTVYTSYRRGDQE